MAKVKLAKGKEFKFKPIKEKEVEKNPVVKYDWDAWLSGDRLMLQQSTGEKDKNGTVITVDEKRDYESPTNQMPAKIKAAARKRYKVVEIKRTDPEGRVMDDAIIIQARNMNTEERVTEELMRANEKERALLKKGQKVLVASEGSEVTGQVSENCEPDKDGAEQPA